MTITRRVSRPTRLSLAAILGSDIDGAWWPQRGSVANELPELVSALLPRVGEVADILINWSARDGVHDLHAVALRVSNSTRLPCRPRLMRVSTMQTCVKLLVIPSITSAELGNQVLRVAAGHAIYDVDQNEESVIQARRVLAVARAESAYWTGQLDHAAGCS
ncbi:MAG: DUF5994 family protein [Mycobacterium sp.]|nr:DUF5994 family protein [Mycobacterium sp.]